MPIGASSPTLPSVRGWTAPPSTAPPGSPSPPMAKAPYRGAVAAARSVRGGRDGPDQARGKNGSRSTRRISKKEPSTCRRRHTGRCLRRRPAADRSGHVRVAGRLARRGALAPPRMPEGSQCLQRHREQDQRRAGGQRQSPDDHDGQRSLQLGTGTESSARGSNPASVHSVVMRIGRRRRRPPRHRLVPFPKRRGAARRRAG